MELPDEMYEKLRELCRSLYSMEITHEEARELGLHLMEYLRVVYKL